MSHFDTIRKEEVKLKIRPFVIQMRGKVEVATNFCTYATAGWKIVTLGLPPVSKTETLVVSYSCVRRYTFEAKLRWDSNQYNKDTRRD